MPIITLPQKPKHTKISSNEGKFEINDCYPGYGTTLGNALRRILLSSLEGSAISAVKIKGASHEFSTIPGVMEDIVHIILNLKKVRIKTYSDEPVKLELKFKGLGEVRAKDIKRSAEVEIVNPEQIIATLTDKKASLEMELEITKGLGYVPVEQQKRENKEIGIIAVDAIYTPVVRVNYTVEDMRVGKRTDFNKITFEIVTDGSISPEEAFSKSVKILVDQFNALSEIALEEKKVKEEESKEIEEKVVKKAETDKGEMDYLKMEVSELSGLSNRTINTLQENKVSKVKNIIAMTEGELMELKGMGEKGVKEIKKAVGEFGATLRQE